MVFLSFPSPATFVSTPLFPVINRNLRQFFRQLAIDKEERKPTRVKNKIQYQLIPNQASFNISTWSYDFFDFKAIHLIVTRFSCCNYLYSTNISNFLFKSWNCKQWCLFKLKLTVDFKTTMLNHTL